MVVDMIKRKLCKVNNYPRKFVQNITNYNLHKTNNIEPNLTEGNNSKEIFINFKQARQKREQLMPKRKKIVINSSEDVVKPKIIYNSAKLSQYFNVKDPVPQKKSDLVYKCTCPQINCNESYIGESERCFEERIIPY